jgi:hypothetical protein
MIHLSDIHPLTAFLRDHKAHMERLAATGRPEVLTVNGRARVVIQDAAAYQQLLEAIDTLDAQRVIGERLASLDRGGAGVPAAKVLRGVRRTLGIKKDSAA